VRIDISGIDARIAKVSFTLASDVTNPLLGHEGAARVFAPQKGATPADVEVLEQSLTHFASLVGGDFASIPGAGAAGGFGFMAYVFLNAQAQSGIDVILDLVGFDSHLAGAVYVITGEGKFDSQSVKGKAPWGILQRAKKLKIPTFLVCGGADIEQGSEFTEIFTLTSLEPDTSKCINNPAPLVTQLGAKIAQSIQKL
jgi:glycerate 2-kinase